VLRDGREDHTWPAVCAAHDAGSPFSDQGGDQGLARVRLSVRRATVEAGEPGEGLRRPPCVLSAPAAAAHEASTLGYMAGGPKVNQAAGIPDWLMPVTRPRGIFS
jgi:hypothetical protein